MPLGQENIDGGVVAETSNGTETTLDSRTIAQDAGGGLQVRVVARRVSDGATKVFNFEGGFKRVGSANVVEFGINLLSTQGTVGDLAALVNVTANIDASGDDIRVRGKGLASTTFEWSVRVRGEYLTQFA